MAQSYVDVGLTHWDVQTNKLQLLGIAALFMAAKFEEIDAHTAPRFAKFTSGCCSAMEICSKERELIKLMRWRLNPDTLNFWLEYYVRMWDQFVVLARLDTAYSIKKTKLEN